MYAKLIDPKTHGKAAYDNKGSSQKAIAYLVHEATQERGGRDIFFNQTGDRIPPEQVQRALDGNTKGLRAKEEKFYSLILSPSERELSYIGNSEQLLKEYTRQVMEIYARNFNLKDGKKLEGKDLLWFGATHWHREYRGTDKEVKEGRAIAGERRPGLQTHVHVIVSARDIHQKISLNPGGRRTRFHLMNWQKAAGRQFEAQFHYVACENEKLKTRKRDTSRDAARTLRIKERIERINLQLPKADRLEAGRVSQIAAEREFDKTFYRSLKHLEQVALSGVPLHHPYHLLKTGREKVTTPKVPRLQARSLLREIEEALSPAGTPKTRTENIGEQKRGKKGEIEIE